MKKKKDKEIFELAERYMGLSAETALILLSNLEKEDELIEKIRVLQSGMLAFYLLIRDKEEDTL